MLSLAYSGNSEEIESFLTFVAENKERVIENNALQYFLANAGEEPIRLMSIRYGSPGISDLAGLGKIVEVVKDIIKDVRWRGAHEERMAGLDYNLKSKDLQGKELEQLETKVNILSKVADLNLAEGDKNRIVHIVAEKIDLVGSLGSNAVVEVQSLPRPQQRKLLQEKRDYSWGDPPRLVAPVPLVEGRFDPEELESRLRNTLSSESLTTPRLVRFLEMLLQSDKPLTKDELKTRLIREGTVSLYSEAGAYEKSISRLLSKKNNAHLRHLIEISHGRTRDEDEFQIRSEYVALVRKVVDDWRRNHAQQVV